MPAEMLGNLPLAVPMLVVGGDEPVSTIARLDRIEVRATSEALPPWNFDRRFGRWRNRLLGVGRVADDDASARFWKRGGGVVGKQRPIPREAIAACGRE